MTNREKIREVFPHVIFIYQKVDDKTNAIMCSDEWLDNEYIEPQAESNIEIRKPCINYEDGCEEWAGCPCVHFKARK